MGRSRSRSYSPTVFRRNRSRSPFRRSRRDDVGARRKTWRGRELGGRYSSAPTSLLVRNIARDSRHQSSPHYSQIGSSHSNCFITSLSLFEPHHIENGLRKPLSQTQGLNFCTMVAASEATSWIGLASLFIDDISVDQPMHRFYKLQKHWQKEVTKLFRCTRCSN